MNSQHCGGLRNTWSAPFFVVTKIIRIALRKQLFLICLQCIFFIFCPSLFGQEWLEYRITSQAGHALPLSGHASALGPNGSVHFSMIVVVDTLEIEKRFFYMRASSQGQILTDTVRLDEQIAEYPDPYYPTVVCDCFDRAWCIWSDGAAGQAHSLYTEIRDSLGNEIRPLLPIGSGGVGGNNEDHLGAAYCSLDSTIIICSEGCGCYHRLNLEGDTIEWARPLPDRRPPSVMKVKTAPDGSVWAGTRHSIGQPADIVLYKFTHDTVNAYYPFGHSNDQRWGLYDFAIGRNNDIYCLAYHDTATLSYFRLDSNYSILERQTLEPSYSVRAGLGLDSDGNCMIMWHSSEHGDLKWALHDSATNWLVPPCILRARDTGSAGFRVFSPNPGQWIVTCARYGITMFTLGIPPNAVHNTSGTAASSLSPFVHPNPFGSFLLIEPMQTQGGDVRIFDILGRQIFVQRTPPSGQAFRLESPQMQQWPSGMYFLFMESQMGSVSVPLIHVR